MGFKSQILKSQIPPPMTYERFEDLPVWKDAMRLAEGCEDFLLAAGNRITRGKVDQLDRASLSVSNNIAEGFERGTTAELLTFLYIARGSAGEVRSMLHFFERREGLGDLRFRISGLKVLAEGCSRQLRAWADHLQNSPIEGQRRLNQSTRENYEKSRKRIEAAEKWVEIQQHHLAKLPADHPLRKSIQLPKA